MVEDMWLDPLVQRRWQQLALRLTEADCRRIGRIAADPRPGLERHPLAGNGGGHRGLGARIGRIRERRRRPGARDIRRDVAVGIGLVSCDAHRTVATPEPPSALSLAISNG